jgi:REP element-mobilizing transposase RayT
MLLKVVRGREDGVSDERSRDLDDKAPVCDIAREWWSERGMWFDRYAKREVTIMRGAVSPDHIHLLVTAFNTRFE